LIMAIKFNPTGQLDITTDPMDLPEEVDQKNVVSGAMVRCKNLNLNAKGIAKTRRGSSLKNATACTETINHLKLLDTDRYEFGGDQVFCNESSIVTGLSAAYWDSLVYKAYNDTDQSIFATNGVNRKRMQNGVAYEWGIDAPAAAPTLREYISYAATYAWEVTAAVDGYQFTQVLGGQETTYFWEISVIEGTPEFDEVKAAISTGLSDILGTTTTDKFMVKYTYCRKDGDLLLYESNPSPAGNTNLENYIYMTWVVPSDTSITHVRAYRTLANFGDYYYAGEFAIDAAFGVLAVDDEDLGSLVDTDHDRVPLGGTVLAGPDFNGICFMGVGNSLYYSKPKQPEYWPALYNVECGSEQYPIIGLALLAGQLYAATNHEIYQISGTGSESFFPLPMAAITGTQSKNVFMPIKGYGIFHLGYDGLYLYTGTTDYKISRHFASLWEDEIKHGIPPINKNYLSDCIMAKYENQVWFGYPSGDNQYCNNWLTIELESNLLQGITGKIQYYSTPYYVTAMTVDMVAKDILSADTSGYVRKLDHLGETTDNNTVIPWEIESKEFGSLRKYFPRWARYDIDLGTGATATGEIVLDGVVKQSHPITSSRNIRKRLIDGCTGDRLSIRITGTGTVSIFSAEVE
jgi:hypothetical protein